MQVDPITRLEIAVDVNTGTAVKKLTDVATALRDLKSASLGESRLGFVANQITSLSTAINGINIRKNGALPKLANELKSLESVGGIRLPSRLAGTITDIANAVNSLKGTDYSGIKDFVKGISKLEGLSKIRIQASLGDAIVGVAEAAQQVKNADFSGLQKFADGVRVLSTLKLSGIGTFLAEIAKLPALIEMLNNIDVAQFVDKVNEIVTALKPLAETVNQVSSSFERIFGVTPQAVQAFKEVTKEKENAEKAAKPEKVQEYTISISTLTTWMKKLSSSMLKAVSSLGKFVGGLASSAIGAFTNKIKNMFSSVERMIKRIKSIILIRAIRAAIRQITSGIKEGIDNLYQWSALVDGRFKSSMDQIATSMLYLKNSIAAMVAPIINKLAPAIDYLVDKFVDLLNIINQVFAALTGQETWTKAIKYPVQYAESVADAAKETAEGYKEATKELKLFLLPFDELNTLDKDNPAGDSTPGTGSGGAGGGGINYAEMFENRKLEDWAKKIKDLIDQGEWYKAGAALANHLWDIVDQWNSYEWGKELAAKINGAIEFALGLLQTFPFEGLGEKIGGAINGFVEEFNWYNFGALLAEKTNSVFEFLKGMFKEFNGKSFGEGLASLFNGWVNTMDAQVIVDAINLGVEDATQIIIAFFDNADAKELATKISEILCGVDWNGIMKAVWEVAKSAIGFGWDLGSTLLDNLWNGYEYETTDENGNKVTVQHPGNKGLVLGAGAAGLGAISVGAIGTLIEVGVTVLSVLSKLGLLGGGGLSLSSLFPTSGVLTGLTSGAEAAGTGAFAGAGATAAGIAGGIIWQLIEKTGFSILTAKGLSTLNNSFNTGSSSQFKAGSTLTGAGLGGLLLPLVSSWFFGHPLLSLLTGGLLGTVFGNKNEENFETQFGRLSKSVEGVTTKTKDAKIAIEELFQSIFGNADPAKDKLADVATEESKTGTVAKQAAQDIEDAFSGMPGWFYDIWEGIKKPFVDAWESIKREFNDRIDQIKRDFNDFKDYIDVNFKQPIEAIFGNLGQAIVYLVEGDFGKAVASAERAINALITVAENAINMIVGGFNNHFIAPANEKLAEWGIDYQIDYIPEVSLGRIQNITAGEDVVSKNAAAASKGVSGSGTTASEYWDSITSAVFGGSQDMNVNVYLDGEQIANNTVEHINEATRRNGRSALYA